MKDFLETTIGKILLGAIVIVVWGVNVISFSELNSGSDIQSVQQVQDIRLSELTIPEEIKYTYTPSSRDPFMREGRQVIPAETRPEPVAEEMNYIQPRLVLAGIFDGMAVIMDDLGQSFFVENGDTFKQDILVKRIVQDSVILEYMERNITLKLN